MVLPAAAKRFLAYAAVGVSTFGVDMGLFLTLITFTPLPSPLAAALGFFVGININYVCSRTLVFTGTRRSWAVGYANFIGFALAGTLLTASGVALLNGLSPLAPAFHRALVAPPIGLLNYAFNLYINFNVAGKPHA